MARVADAAKEERSRKRHTTEGVILESLRARSEQEIVITQVTLTFSGGYTGLAMFKGVYRGQAVCMFAGFGVGEEELAEALEKGWRREGKWADDRWPSSSQKRLMQPVDFDDRGE